MTEEELKRRSDELGLSQLASDHAADLAKALDNGKALAGKIPTDLHWSEEAAHTFSLAGREKVKT